MRWASSSAAVAVGPPLPYRLTLTYRDGAGLGRGDWGIIGAMGEAIELRSTAYRGLLSPAIRRLRPGHAPERPSAAVP
jgi:hypothetical protein